MFNIELRQLASALLDEAKQRKTKIATAESCTGGLLSALLTDISGSSAVFERGFVTYSNSAKIECLGVSTGLIAAHGAVSAEVAQAMAIGTIEHSNADIALSITGIAGPKSDDTQKPVGLVFIGLASKNSAFAKRFDFGNLGRDKVRLASVKAALAIMTAHLKEA